jgi:hypothetical protein
MQLANQLLKFFILMIQNVHYHLHESAPLLYIKLWSTRYTRSYYKFCLRPTAFWSLSCVSRRYEDDNGTFFWNVCEILPDYTELNPRRKLSPKSLLEESKIQHWRFEVFTAVTMKIGVFWDVMPCGSCKKRWFLQEPHGVISQKTPF